MIKPILFALQRRAPTILPSNKRAAVAMIFRVKPFENVVPRTFKSVRELIESGYEQSGELEILYIKRTVRTGDRWSGHVAFPGGKKDAGESDLTTAKRETMEEVGLDLACSSDFEYLGRLDDRIVPATGRTDPLVLCAFLFVQLKGTSIPMKIQQGEVSAARWVPLNVLQRDKVQYVAMEVSRAMVPFSAKFPTIVLPCRDAADTETFQLWGLTLRATSDLLEKLGKPRLDDPPIHFENPVIDVLFVGGMRLLQHKKKTVAALLLSFTLASITTLCYYEYYNT